MADAGYSGTPLARKLGLKPGMTVLLAGAPPHYGALLAPLPDGVVLVDRMGSGVGLAHLFCTRRAELAPLLAQARRQLGPAVPVWVFWPKMASRQPTDLSEDVLRELALPLGFVDVKVCAVDAVWSGLKLVVRRALR